MREHESEAQKKDGDRERREVRPGRGHEKIGRRGRRQAQRHEARPADPQREAAGEPAGGDDADAEDGHEEADPEGLQAESLGRIGAGVAERTQNEQAFDEHDKVGAQAGPVAQQPSVRPQELALRIPAQPAADLARAEIQRNGDHGGDGGVGDEQPRQLETAAIVPPMVIDVA